MDKEEVELMPCGLVTGFIDGREVRILKISPQKLEVRLSEETDVINNLKVAFYFFEQYRYEEVEIKEYTLREIVQEEFYIRYIFSIDDDEYSKNVRRIFKDYYRYIMLKNYGEENEFSKEMTGYPCEKDYDFFDYYSDVKKKWLCELNYEEFDEHILANVEFAIKLDNDNAYREYLKNDIKSFKESYLKENYINEHKLFKKDVCRIYIGNEFCHNLFPSDDILFQMLKKAQEENLMVTLCFTYMRDCYIDKTNDILEKVYEWSRQKNRKIEVVINDWGMLNLLEGKNDVFIICLGVLLNKRKKDPRYTFKQGYEHNKELMSQNNLNSRHFVRFLKKWGINRYEYENCGYKIAVAEGNHSLQIPFYVTNTSQYCTLYAMCTNLDRGKQKLVKSCPKYCSEYVFAYPEHLKMVGRYNSLFAFDDTLLSNPKLLKNYIESGIDRIVLNFI